MIVSKQKSVTDEIGHNYIVCASQVTTSLWHNMLLTVVQCSLCSLYCSQIDSNVMPTLYYHCHTVSVLCIVPTPFLRLNICYSFIFFSLLLLSNAVVFVSHQRRECFVMIKINNNEFFLL